MRWWILPVCLLLLLPGVIAGSKSGWYYQGQSFVFEGVNYSVASNDPDRLLLVIDGRSKLVTFGECVTEGLTEYCYEDTAYPSDDDHIEYEGGEAYYGNYLSISSLEPDISVDHEASEEDPEVGETVSITIRIVNEGDFSVQGFTYEVAVPDGLRSSDGKPTVTVTKPSIPVGATEVVSYRVTPTKYGKFTLKPTVWYLFNGARKNVTLSALTIEADSPIDVKHRADATLGLDQEGWYHLNLTNKAEDPVSVTAVVTVPDGISIGKPVRFKQEGGKLIATADIAEDKTSSFSFPFTGSRSGSFTIPLEVSFKTAGADAEYLYNDTVKVEFDGVVASIKLSPDRLSFTAGEAITIKAVLENQNDDTAFKDVAGTLSAPGILEDKRFNHAGFGAGKSLTEIEERVTLPTDIQSTKNFTISLSGSYKSPEGMPLSFSAKKTVSIAPMSKNLRLSRTVSPQSPKPGDTITVAVMAESIAGSAVTIDANEKIVPSLSVADGTTFKSMTVRSGSPQEVYSYRLAIPSNFTGQSLVITTVVREQGAASPTELSTTVPIGGTPSQGSDAPAGDGSPEVTGDAPADEEMGFFESIWNFLKGLLE